VFLDFDGTLSEIAAAPELAVPEVGALDVLARMVEHVDLTVVLSGRPVDDLRRLIPVDGVELIGLYGLGDTGQSAAPLRQAIPEIHEAVRRLPGVRVEDKGLSVTVHYRQANDPDRARRDLDGPLEEIASKHGLTVFEAKMAYELMVEAGPGKGAVVERLAIEHGLRACAFAGDDLPDLSAFRALDEQTARDVFTIKVAVRSEETPASLLEAADVVVERPAGLVAWLEDLVRTPGPEAGP
jgi:trehalose 6-phosphate phosphatase